MASPSNFREAEPRQFVKCNLGMMTGLGTALLTLLAQPVAAQDEAAGAVPAGEVIPASEDDAPAQETPAYSPPEPAPVPPNLDQLIPPDAVEDPEGWATRGAIAPAAGQPPADQTALAPGDPFADDPAGGARRLWHAPGRGDGQRRDLVGGSGLWLSIDGRYARLSGRDGQYASAAGGLWRIGAVHGHWRLDAGDA